MLADQDDPEWSDRDPDMLDGLFIEHDVQSHFLPTADYGAMTGALAQRLCDVVSDARARDELVLVHCWMGRARTWYAVRMLGTVLDGVGWRKLDSRHARETAFVIKQLECAKLPHLTSGAAERSQLILLAAGLHCVGGGNGLFDPSRDAVIKKRLSAYKTEADMFAQAVWPFKLDHDEIQANVGKEKLAAIRVDDFGSQLRASWPAHAHAVLLAACNGDEALVSAVLDDIKRIGYVAIRDAWDNQEQDPFALARLIDKTS